MKSAAIFAACIILATVAIANCESQGERLAELMEKVGKHVQESKVPIVAETAKQLILIAGSDEFKELVDAIDETVAEMAQAYLKFTKGAIDGLCELKDNPDATPEDYRNMLESISID